MNECVSVYMLVCENGPKNHRLLLCVAVYHCHCLANLVVAVGLVCVCALQVLLLLLALSFDYYIAFAWLHFYWYTPRSVYYSQYVNSQKSLHLNAQFFPLRHSKTKNKPAMIVHSIAVHLMFDKT